MVLGVARAAQHIPDDLLDARGKGRRAGHDACARQREMLPRPGFALLIASRMNRAWSRPGPERPDGRNRMSTLIERAVVRLRRERTHQPLRTREVLPAIERARPVGLRVLLVEVIDDDEIEIGGRGHLATAELAQRQHGDLLPRQACHARATNACPRHCDRTARIRHPRARANAPRLLRRYGAGQDTRTDQEHLLPPELPGAVEQVFVGKRLRERARQFRPELSGIGSAPKNDGSISASMTCGCSAPECPQAAAPCRASARGAPTRSGLRSRRGQEPRSAVQTGEEAIERGQRAHPDSRRGRDDRSGSAQARRDARGQTRSSATGIGPRAIAAPRATPRRAARNPIAASLSSVSVLVRVGGR